MDKPQCVTIQMKAIEQYFHAILFVFFQYLHLLKVFKKEVKEYDNKHDLSGCGSDTSLTWLCVILFLLLVYDLCQRTSVGPACVTV